MLKSVGVGLLIGALLLLMLIPPMLAMTYEIADMVRAAQL